MFVHKTNERKQIWKTKWHDGAVQINTFLAATRSSTCRNVTAEQLLWSSSRHVACRIANGFIHYRTALMPKTRTNRHTSMNGGSGNSEQSAVGTLRWIQA
eukprot:366486-Chlamydomonas_euryale.AAC.5